MKARLIVLMTVLLVLLGNAPQSGLQASELDNHIILSEGGLVMVTVNNVITNYCNGAAGLYSPQNIELFPDYNNKRGESVTIGPFEAGTELIFYISPWSHCSGYTYLSTNPAHARTTPLEVANSWRIDWEDLPDHWPPDNDFNDLILVVRLVGTGVPDFKQDDPSWEDDPYDNIFEQLEATIGTAGCATTASADLLHYYGAYEVDPQTLDDCLSSDSIKGYVRWDEDPDCREGTLDKCSAGAIRWPKVGMCSNPYSPYPEPHLMRWVQKLNVGDWTEDPGTGELVQVTKDMLKELTDEDLTKGWPVIFEVPHPQSPSGVHFVVATGKVTSTYSINDPWCGAWPTCPGSKSTLEDYGDNLRGIVRFAPADGVFHPSLILNGFSPIEFYVTDPLGRRTGYSAAGGHFAEIPNANYYFQPPIVDQTSGQPQGDGMIEFYVIDPLPGDYVVTVIGTDSGDYSVLAEHHAAPLTTFTAQQTGTVTAGSIALYNLEVSPNSPPEWAPIPLKHVYLPIVMRGSD